MARPKKIGLDFFPLNVQMNDKVDMLEAVHGLEGFALYIKLLQEIYQTEHGELDMSVIFRWKTLGKKYGIPEENLRNITGTMLEIGLLDKEAFELRQVFTSNGVKRVLQEVGFRRKKDRLRKTEADLEFSSGKPSENAGKEKKKKRNNISVAEASDVAQKEEKAYTLTHQIRLFIQQRSPGYHWSAKDGKNAKELADKLKSAYVVQCKRDPTDAEVIDSLSVLIDESAALTPYYQFQDIPKFNERYNAIVGLIKARRKEKTQEITRKRSVLEITE